jgi:hypothetical protein
VRIPKRFKILGRTVEVVWVDDLLQSSDFCGAARYRMDQVALQTPNDAYRPTPAQLENTFCHEVVHWMLYMSGNHDLNKQESAVELLGAMLHQILSTAEYDEDA